MLSPLDTLPLNGDEWHNLRKGILNYSNEVYFWIFSIVRFLQSRILLLVPIKLRVFNIVVFVPAFPGYARPTSTNGSF